MTVFVMVFAPSLFAFTFLISVGPIHVKDIRRLGWGRWMADTPTRQREPLVVADWLPAYGKMFLPGFLCLASVCGGVIGLFGLADIGKVESLVLMLAGTLGIGLFTLYISRPSRT